MGRNQNNLPVFGFACTLPPANARIQPNNRSNTVGLLFYRIVNEGPPPRMEPREQPRPPKLPMHPVLACFVAALIFFGYLFFVGIMVR